jgi:hypothetical protein
MAYGFDRPPEPYVEDEILSNVNVNGRRLTWRELAKRRGARIAELLNVPSGDPE